MAQSKTGLASADTVTEPEFDRVRNLLEKDVL